MFDSADIRDLCRKAAIEDVSVAGDDELCGAVVELSRGPVGVGCGRRAMCWPSSRPGGAAIASLGLSTAGWVAWTAPGCRGGGHRSGAGGHQAAHGASDVGRRGAGRGADRLRPRPGAGRCGQPAGRGGHRRRAGRAGEPGRAAPVRHLAAPGGRAGGPGRPGRRASTPTATWPATACTPTGSATPSRSAGSWWGEAALTVRPGPRTGDRRPVARASRPTMTPPPSWSSHPGRCCEPWRWPSCAATAWPKPAPARWSTSPSSSTPGRHRRAPPTATAVDPRTCSHLWCDPILHTLVVDPSEPLDLKRSVRYATPAQRRALAIRDRRLRVPRLWRPTRRWCDAHHIIEWEHDGDTDMANMALLCRHHHGVTHRHGWTMTALPPAGSPGPPPPAAPSTAEDPTRPDRDLGRVEFLLRR